MGVAAKTQKTWKFPAPKKEIREALTQAFEGRMERVSWKSTDRAIYGRDLWPRELLSLRRGERPAGPAAIVLAKEARDVEDAMKLSRRLDLPLVPYADGSGVCGGARGASDALVLDLKALNKIDPIDEKSLTVRAQCGVQGEKLERALNRAGYTLGHFPSSIYTSTVGGWVSTRSAGQLSTKYGKIEDMVVGLECVLPDGSRFVTPDAPRSAAGPDFKQIMIGAEGTLGIITAAKLRIHRYPEHREFLSFEFPDWNAATESVREIMQRGLTPAVVRLYDEADTQLNASHMKIQVKGILGVFVCEGEQRLTEFEARKLAEICEGQGGRPLGEGPARRWWEHRYDVSYNMSKVLPNKGMVLDTIELAATWTALPELYEKVRAALASEAMIVLCHLSHAYITGASLYFSIVARSESEDKVLEKYDAIWKKAMDAAHACGSTISHHHGVGELKAKWMSKEHGALQDLYAGLRAQLDPQGLLNPGKMGLAKHSKKSAPRGARGGAS